MSKSKKKKRKNPKRVIKPRSAITEFMILNCKNRYLQDRRKRRTIEKKNFENDFE